MCILGRRPITSLHYKKNNLEPANTVFSTISPDDSDTSVLMRDARVHLRSGQLASLAILVCVLIISYGVLFRYLNRSS